ncbi:hypothetical protein FHS29_003006 [Saccharothrix tamanrassetensis]|uniref:Uncharacterized protein n=1 Tax=Saccharothrix tamanrassetensis TaxID=1051531 RepID=A0A841CHF9_9PSEU|nr:hypothetical protein [Saccharothrix tamanrassetensis]
MSTPPRTPRPRRTPPHRGRHRRQTRPRFVPWAKLAVGLLIQLVLTLLRA